MEAIFDLELKSVSQWNRLLLRHRWKARSGGNERSLAGWGFNCVVSVSCRSPPKASHCRSLFSPFPPCFMWPCFIYLTILGLGRVVGAAWPTVKAVRNLTQGGRVSHPPILLHSTYLDAKTVKYSNCLEISP